MTIPIANLVQEGLSEVFKSQYYLPDVTANEPARKIETLCLITLALLLIYASLL